VRWQLSPRSKVAFTLSFNFSLGVNISLDFNIGIGISNAPGLVNGGRAGAVVCAVEDGFPLVLPAIYRFAWYPEVCPNFVL
jgi:hypothetical protein